jgi:hypothetical protein
VDSCDLLAVVPECVLEGILAHALGRRAGDELEGLDDAVDDDVLGARVLSLCILADGDDVDIFVPRFDARHGHSRADVCVEAEDLAECEVEGAVALADGGRHGSLESEAVAAHAGESVVGHRALFRGSARDVDFLLVPQDAHLRRGVDAARRRRSPARCRRRGRA